MQATYEIGRPSFEARAGLYVPREEARPVIRLEQIHKTYTTGDVEVHALRGVSLDIREGEFVAIMGTSGSGKSTTMNIIGCLDRPTRGSYVLDGRDVSALSKDERADIRLQKIGFVFQGFNLLARTSALENVELPLLYRGEDRRPRRAQGMAALAKVGLADWSHHNPSQLSGGQQQRVAIARALVTQPDVLLADEPTGNLDSAMGDEILELLRALNADGATVVMVTHDERQAAKTDRVIRLFDGRQLNN